MTNQPENLIDRACLVVHGPDRPGLVAATAAVVADHGGNVITHDHFTSPGEDGHFYERISFHRPALRTAMGSIEADLERTLGPLGLEWSLSDQSVPKRMAVLASKSDHCLLELLWRHRRGELPVTIPLVISNHLDVEEDVRSFGIPFHHIPSAGPDKSDAESAIVDLLADTVDFVVLARYMQILSTDFLRRVEVPVINIHHSFLPAFVGAAPYRKAKERGVKLIGATSHYVTEELDAGPIIEQDVARVTHADDAADLQRRGAYVERAVLSRAVQWHAEDRVIRHGNQAIVF